MKSFAAVAAVAGLAAALPQSEYTPSGTFSTILPSTTAGAGCKTTYPGTFEIEVLNATSSSKVKRATALSISLNNGILTDSQGRIGYIASNDQFQFDFGGQAGEKTTAGWAVCANGTLSLGADSTFYECLSGTFYNLYDENDAAQCSAVYIQVINTSGSATTAAATEAADGQITASPVTQIGDGQIQATTGLPVTQISDGQIQATTAAASPVTQISDGQIQATTGVPVTQISDGQIQATTATANPVTQISDGQIQAQTGSPVTQISDGQIQASATNGTRPTSATATVQAFTGAAALPSMRAELFGLAAGVMAVALL